MATNAKIEALTISIAGLIDPSLLRSFAEVENKLKAFGSSVKTQNAIMSQVYKTSFASLAPAAEDAFSKAQKHASSFHDFMGEVKSTMVGVFAVDMAQRFFDAAIEGAKSFGREMKAASDAAANMEIQKSNLQAATQLNDKQMEALQSYFWQKSIAVPVTVPTQMAGFKRIEETITESDVGKRIALGKAESDKLLDLASLAINPAQGGNIVEAINEKYRDVVDTVTKAQMYGIANQRVLSEFEGMGINVRPGMMLEKGLINEEQFAHWSSMAESERDQLLGEFAKDVKKRTVFENLIMDQINQLTSPGGKAFGRAAAIAGTTGGIESSTADVMNFIMTKVGEIENGPLRELLGGINTGFAKQIPLLTPIFDQISAKFEKAFGTEILPKIERFGSELGAALSKLSGQGSLDEKIDKIVYNMGRLVDSITFLSEFMGKVGAMIPPWMKPWLPDLGQWNRPGPAPDAPKTWEQWHKGGSVIDNPDAFPHAAQAATTSLAEMNNKIDVLTGNDLTHLIPVVDKVTASFDVLTSAMARFSFGNFPMPGMPGSGYGSGSSSNWTVFGPGVAGDQPGGPTYDSNSYNGRGAYGPLSAGDTAMHPEYAEKHYGIKPGQLYRSDKDGKLHRWMDKTGSPNPENEDVYVPKGQAAVNINYSPTFHLVGESDHIRAILRQHADELAGHIRRVFESDDARSAVV